MKTKPEVVFINSYKIISRYLISSNIYFTATKSNINKYVNFFTVAYIGICFKDGCKTKKIIVVLSMLHSLVSENRNKDLNPTTSYCRFTKYCFTL